MKACDMFLWRSLGWASSPFLYFRRQQPLWLLWWRAGFVGIGLMFAVAGVIGEIRHVEALKSREMSSILLGNIRASAIFPFPARIREANAALHAMMGGVPPLVALIELRRALLHAPNSPVLHFWLAYHRIRIGDLIGASETLAKLKSIGPDWPQTKLVEGWLEAARKKETTP